MYKNIHVSYLTGDYTLAGLLMTASEKSREVRKPISSQFDFYRFTELSKHALDIQPQKEGPPNNPCRCQYILLQQSQSCLIEISAIVQVSFDLRGNAGMAFIILTTY